jgi:Family of unknown function (DUF6263)
MKKNILFTISIVFAFTGTFAQNNGTVALNKGQKYTLQSKVTTSSSSEIQGQTMETNADITTVYDIEVTDIFKPAGVKDSNYKMNNKISAIKMNMNSLGQNINFDSDKKEDMDGEIGSNIKGIINQPNNVVMDKSGNIILDAEASTKSDSSTANDATGQTEMILKQMGDPVQQGYGAKLAFMPISKKAKAGSSWQDSASADGVTRVTNYTIKEINGNIATITVSGTENRDTKVEMQQMEIETKTTGKFTGEQNVDITSGAILKNTISMDATGTLRVMGQDIPTTIKATTVNTVTPM